MRVYLRKKGDIDTSIQEMCISTYRFCSLYEWVCVILFLFVVAVLILVSCGFPQTCYFESGNVHVPKYKGLWKHFWTCLQENTTSFVHPCTDRQTAQKEWFNICQSLTKEYLTIRAVDLRPLGFMTPLCMTKRLREDLRVM